MHNIAEFGTITGEKVHCISLKNKKGTELKVLTLGATWHSFNFQDAHGKLRDIIVSPKSLKGYLQQNDLRPYYFGSSIGRYAGRISTEKCRLNGKPLQLSNIEGVHLHGGSGGLHSKIWKISDISLDKNPYLTLTCTSGHLEEGYPGNLSVSVTYILTERDQVKIVYEATTDTDTILNLTNHAYFNLAETSVLGSSLQVGSETLLETDEKLIPTGNYLSIAGTPYDFGSLKKLGQITEVGDLDNCFIFKKNGSGPQLIMFSEQSGIRLQMESNQPAVVIYAPRTLKFALPPKNEGWKHMEYPALCIEPQNFPDAPSNDNFPSSLLKKGERYRNEILYDFSLK